MNQEYPELLIRNLRVEVETLKNELKLLGIKQHAGHSNVCNNTNTIKFVEGKHEEVLKEWKDCKYTFCKKVYNICFGEDK